MGIECSYSPEHFRKRAEQFRAKAESSSHGETRDALLKPQCGSMSLHVAPRTSAALRTWRSSRPVVDQTSTYSGTIMNGAR